MNRMGNSSSTKSAQCDSELLGEIFRTCQVFPVTISKLLGGNQSAYVCCEKFQ